MIRQCPVRALSCPVGVLAGRSGPVARSDSCAAPSAEPAPGSRLFSPHPWPRWVPAVVAAVALPASGLSGVQATLSRLAVRAFRWHPSGRRRQRQGHAVVTPTPPLSWQRDGDPPAVVVARGPGQRPAYWSGPSGWTGPLPAPPGASSPRGTVVPARTYPRHAEGPGVSRSRAFTPGESETSCPKERGPAMAACRPCSRLGAVPSSPARRTVPVTGPVAAVRPAR